MNTSDAKGAAKRGQKKKATGSGRNVPLRPRYARWLESFELPSVKRLLERLAREGVDVEQVRKLLYAAPHLRKLDFRRQMKEWDRRLSAALDYVQDAANLLAEVPEIDRLQRNLLLGALRESLNEELHSHKQFPQVSDIDLTDWIITYLARELNRVGIRTVNKSIADMLIAAEIPGGGREGCAWSAEAVKKRRDRFKKNPLATSQWPALLRPKPPQAVFYEAMGEAFQKAFKSHQ